MEEKSTENNENFQLPLTEGPVATSRKKSIEVNKISYVITGLLSLIVILLICNLGATAFLVIRALQAPNSATNSGMEPLPESLKSADNKAQLLLTFQELYNAKDSDGLYSLLDPFAQIDIPEEKFTQQLEGIYQLTGKIEDGVFSRYQYQGISNDRKWFLLEYKIRTEKGAATLTITITQQDNEDFHFVGFNINQR